MALINKLCIAGVGLIGGSIGMAARKRGVARSVMGLVRRESAVEESKEAGAVDVATCDNEEAVKEADLVIIATTLGVMSDVAKKIAPFISDECVVSDIGSVKEKVVKEMEAIFGEKGCFVGGHPIAGSEKRGVAHARADLFEDCTFVMTPGNGSDPEAIELLEKFWKKLGARVCRLTPSEHDTIMARVSHLPHILAVALVNCIARQPQWEGKILPFAGPGFKDSTRIAASAPDIWVEICMSNRENLLNALGPYEIGLKKIKEILKSADTESLKGIFLQGSQLRRNIASG